MNITQVTGLRFIAPVFSQNKQYNNVNYGISMKQPLAKDTVSFSGTPKMLSSRSEGVSLKVATAVSKAAEPMQEKIKVYLNDLLGDLKVTDLKPNNPILKICDRVKSPGSIVEKSATRQYNCKAEILDFMTDLNGAKIVMRDGRKKAVQKVLSRFIPEIEKGEIELLEIENKRPIVTKKLKRTDKEKYDYASIDFLEKMQRVQEETWENLDLKERPTVSFNMNDFTELNYSAIHFLFKLRGEPRPFELTILGKDVNELKDLDDKLFKILNNKNVDKKYKPLVDIVAPLKEPANKIYLGRFNQYRSEAFLFQKEREPNTFLHRSGTPSYFLPLSSNLPPELDLNNLNRIMLECDLKESKKKIRKKIEPQAASLKEKNHLARANNADKSSPTVSKKSKV